MRALLNSQLINQRMTLQQLHHQQFINQGCPLTHQPYLHPLHHCLKYFHLLFQKPNKPGKLLISHLCPSLSPPYLHQTFGAANTSPYPTKSILPFPSTSSMQFFAQKQENYLNSANYAKAPARPDGKRPTHARSVVYSMADPKPTRSAKAPTTSLSSIPSLFPEVKKHIPSRLRQPLPPESRPFSYTMDSQRKFN